jgi:hypothetical protein
MTFADIEALTIQMRAYYPKCDALAPAMVRLWAEELQQVDETTCGKALARWVRQHTAKPPSLDELAEQVAFVREEEHRPWRPRIEPGSNLWRAARGEGVEASLAVVDKKTGEILRDEEDVTFGRLMRQLTEWSMAPWEDTKGALRPQLTPEDRAQLCESWAMTYQYEHPALAEDLRQVARRFREEQARQQEVA